MRIVLVPKSRTVDATLLMESLFRLSDLESRLPLNMNVLSLGKVPKVMALNEVLTGGWRTARTCWSAARAIVWRQLIADWKFWAACSSLILILMR